MIRRQQTQLGSFLSGQEDPTFVFSESQEMKHSNTAALKLFHRSGSIDIKLDTKIFQFKRTDELNKEIEMSNSGGNFMFSTD